MTTTRIGSVFGIGNRIGDPLPCQRGLKSVELEFFEMQPGIWKCDPDASNIEPHPRLIVEATAEDFDDKLRELLIKMASAIQ